MMTVRFPNGQFVQYNNAAYLVRDGNDWCLYTAKPDSGGKWIASISAAGGCVVEGTSPCKIGVIHIEPDKFIDELVDRLKEVTAYRLARLKSALRKFDSRSYCWK